MMNATTSRSLQWASLLVLVLGSCLTREGVAATLTVHVFDQSAAAVTDAVVYAIPAVLSSKPPAPAEIAQVSRTFVPAVTVAQTGAAVSFPNRDTILHQVYSFSPAKVFKLKLYAGLPSTPVVFDKPGLVVLGCNIHDAMVAYVMVVDTPYFGKTVRGVATIEGLPGGSYKVLVWHARLAAETPPQAITVGGDVDLKATVELKS